MLEVMSSGNCSCGYLSGGLLSWGESVIGQVDAEHVRVISIGYRRSTPIYSDLILPAPARGFSSCCNKRSNVMT